MNNPFEFIQTAPIMNFLSGIYMATFMASSLIFFKMWKKMKDRFFLLFGFACFVLGLERIPLLFVQPSVNDGDSWVFFFRLTSFVLILIAIIDTNRDKRKIPPK
jgi:hypothetical protein